MNLNRRLIVLSVVVAVLGTGCVSINTYESQMKRCRELQTTSSGLEQEVASLKQKNKDLETDYGHATKEKERLSQEVAVQEDVITDLRGTYDDLINKLKDDISKGSIRVSQAGGRLTIAMEERILFASGKADVKSEGRPVLSRISQSLKGIKGYDIRIDGHSDNVRIAPSLQQKFPSNWDLAAARSSAVVRALQKEGGLDPRKLILASFSEYRPLVTNKTVKGREQNRRVEITLIKSEGPMAPAEESGSEPSEDQ